MAVVASEGKKFLTVFMPQNERVNAEAHIKILTGNVLPQIKGTFFYVSYAWQQDGAACHMAKETQEYLKQNITNFCGKDMGLPNCHIQISRI